MAAPTLKLKRGLQSALPTLAVGEPGFTTDSYQLYFGSHAGNKFVGGNDNFTLETATVGSGVNLYEATNNGSQFLQLKSPNTLSDKIKDRMLLAWQQRYRPDTGGRRPLILDGGIEIDSYSPTNFKDLDFQNAIESNEKIILKAK